MSAAKALIALLAWWLLVLLLEEANVCCCWICLALSNANSISIENELLASPTKLGTAAFGWCFRSLRKDKEKKLELNLIYMYSSLTLLPSWVVHSRVVGWVVAVISQWFSLHFQIVVSDFWSPVRIPSSAGPTSREVETLCCSISLLICCFHPKIQKFLYKYK